MTDVLIGLVPGIGITVFVLVLLFREQSGRERDGLRAETAEKHLDDAVHDLDASEARARVLEQNLVSLQKQVDDLQPVQRALEAQLATLRKGYDDLLSIVNDQPGAVPPAIHDSLARLRALVSGSITSDPPATGDPGGGETDAVHAIPALHSSR